MDDFYQNPPKTKADVVRYLQAWIVRSVPTADHPCLGICYDGGTWDRAGGFRRAFCNHSIFQCGDRCAFHVDNDFGGWDGSSEPNMGCYESWDAMLQGVAERYCKFWGLEDTNEPTPASQP